MDGIYIPDPNRIIRDSRIGNVQAWGATADDVSVSVSFYATVAHARSERAYISQNLNLTAEDARDLAKLLTEAADHADKFRTVNAEDKPKTLGSAEAMS